jgi:YD repeat-containing protein
VVDGRGVSVSSSGVATLAANAGSYTRHLSYTGSGDLASESTAPITTTLNGVTTASTPVTTTYGYDGDGDQTSVISANGKTTTSGYDHLGRPVTTTLPTVTLYTGATATPVQTTGYDGEGSLVRQVDGTGTVSVSSVDPLGRLVAQTNPISGTTLYTYTATVPTAVQDPHTQGKTVELALAIVGKELAAALVRTGVDRAFLFVLNKESRWARGLRTRVVGRSSESTFTGGLV